MKKIETLLPKLFEARRGNTQQQVKTIETKTTDRMQELEVEWKQTLSNVKTEEQDLLPFAVVDGVQTGSPAEKAGLQVQDQVLRFGTADASNHRELAAVSYIVQRNVNRGIRVLVRRQKEVLAVELIPQTWQGPGMLGCLLQPV